MEQKQKQGILIASFGTTYRETRAKNIDKIAQTVAEAYPDRVIRQAYSSRIVREIIRKQEGIRIPDTAEALQEMKAEGIEEVTILPTHLIDGVEANKVKEAAGPFHSEFRKLNIADVLLKTEEDYACTARALWDSLREEAGERTVILMGHGSYHEADISYEKLERALQDYSGAPVYLATVEGAMTIEDVLCRMAETPDAVKKGVLITTCMLVAGDHAEHDMAGEEDSFRTKVQDAGYEAECVLRGIGEYERIRELYLEHLRRAEE